MYNLYCIPTTLLSLVGGVICSVNFKKDLLVSNWVSNSQIVCLHTTIVYKNTTASGAEGIGGRGILKAGKVIIAL